MAKRIEIWKSVEEIYKGAETNSSNVTTVPLIKHDHFNGMRIRDKVSGAVERVHDSVIVTSRNNGILHPEHVVSGLRIGHQGTWQRPLTGTEIDIASPKQRTDWANYLASRLMFSGVASIGKEPEYSFELYEIMARTIRRFLSEKLHLEPERLEFFDIMAHSANLTAAFTKRVFQADDPFAEKGEPGYPNYLKDNEWTFEGAIPNSLLPRDEIQADRFEDYVLKVLDADPLSQTWNRRVFGFSIPKSLGADPVVDLKATVAERIERALTKIDPKELDNLVSLEPSVPGMNPVYRGYDRLWNTVAKHSPAFEAAGSAEALEIVTLVVRSEVEQIFSDVEGERSYISVLIREVKKLKAIVERIKQEKTDSALIRRYSRGISGEQGLSSETVSAEDVKNIEEFETCLVEILRIIRVKMQMDPRVGMKQIEEALKMDEGMAEQRKKLAAKSS